jgi:hypothetical protein
LESANATIPVQDGPPDDALGRLSHSKESSAMRGSGIVTPLCMAAVLLAMGLVRVDSEDGKKRPGP